MFIVGKFADVSHQEWTKRAREVVSERVDSRRSVEQVRKEKDSLEKAQKDAESRYILRLF